MLNLSQNIFISTISLISGSLHLFSKYRKSNNLKCICHDKDLDIYNNKNNLIIECNKSSPLNNKINSNRYIASFGEIITSGLHYFEVEIINTQSKDNIQIGISSIFSQYNKNNINSYSITGCFDKNNSNIIGCLFNCDNRSLHFYYNGICIGETLIGFKKINKNFLWFISLKNGDKIKINSKQKYSYNNII
jgi:hypothetical protein